ncbi:MAG: AAA family ATPase [Candidatus Blackburnbacteria bacterium]|nr:AAA family ATPase [Candidatus Blackburnbacteria bacterium]
MPVQTPSERIAFLRDRVKSATLPQDLADGVIARLDRLSETVELGSIFDDLDRIGAYVDWIVNLPWRVRSEDTLDLVRAKQVLDKNHYGLEEIKNRILEFVAVIRLSRDRDKTNQNLSSTDVADHSLREWKTNQNLSSTDVADHSLREWKTNQNLSSTAYREGVVHAPILCFVGLVGTGKTTIAYSVAEALGRKIARIPFGGMGSSLDLRGQSRVHLEAEPGQIIKVIRKVGFKNPVVLLDEIDRVSDEARSSIMGFLLELLDPEQNHAFQDYFIDYPFDLSEVLFIATANNTTNISTAVLDRLEVIQMPSYTDEEKINIGKNYMLPRVIEESGLPSEVIHIDDEVWPLIVRPLGYDAGMRTLERTIEGIIRKVAREFVEGKTSKVIITPQNVRQYLPV